MVGFAIRRLASEFKNLIDNPTEGIVAGPINENNMLEWEALCIAPEGCDFDGGVFKIRLDFTLDYPLAPPTARFVTNIFHPNVYQDGRICISILHAPGDDPSGYESKNERWSPSQSIEKILLSIISLLAGKIIS
ncbi:Ubiquitin carrier protein G2 [Intoshia linei]|uniref:Ubiquitin carrier protein G2 n=1 Tax=Intoshia linei TaxID=1819745 RepID=A0A177B8C6_9BILA|nr:Ubiquitin carrier protein G2 [Intoshia linei]